MDTMGWGPANGHNRSHQGWVVLQPNPAQGKGGICFGDSGGPNFLDDGTVVAGITSFGLNGNCAGTGGICAKPLCRTRNIGLRSIIKPLYVHVPMGLF